MCCVIAALLLHTAQGRSRGSAEGDDASRHWEAGAQAREDLAGFASLQKVVLLPFVLYGYGTFSSVRNSTIFR